jgi:hypothetical protein
MLSLCLNLKGSQLSQWQNYDFNSMAKIGGQYVGAGENGLMLLERGDFDNGAPIEAFFELATSDWGIPEQKRIRALYFGYESDGNLMVTVRDDDGNERSFTLLPNHSANLQHGAKITGARDGKGRYWMVRVDNVNGSDFSVDSIQVLPVVLNRRPSAA